MDKLHWALIALLVVCYLVAGFSLRAVYSDMVEAVSAAARVSEDVSRALSALRQDFGEGLVKGRIVGESFVTVLAWPLLAIPFLVEER